jgi:Ser/Thr protein kinase RdoA (MazF antagonist)
MEGLAAAASRWLGRPLRADQQLYGGEEADVWVASSAGQRFVIHVSAVWRPLDEVAWAHAVAVQAATAVPAAVAPISLRGKTSFTWNGRVVAIFPYVEGKPLDRDDADQVADAARLLARIHIALLTWNPPVPSVTLAPSVVDDPLAERELDVWWSQCLPRVRHGVCHGDYYRRNILVADRRIRGVIDWNESHVGPLIREVAFAAWEFGHDEDMHLLLDRFRLFVDAYRSEATHLPDWEYSLVGGAARVGLRDNVRYVLRRGGSIEDDYQHRQISALMDLKREFPPPTR